ncbi:hypothetical protein MXB_77 [Myxobolus squamalis]|nr:hypothetical protein MXB_77 [Myxobolus squamalis]
MPSDGWKPWLEELVKRESKVPLDIEKCAIYLRTGAQCTSGSMIHATPAEVKAVVETIEKEKTGASLTLHGSKFICPQIIEKSMLVMTSPAKDGPVVQILAVVSNRYVVFAGAEKSAACNTFLDVVSKFVQYMEQSIPK